MQILTLQAPLQPLNPQATEFLQRLESAGALASEEVEAVIAAEKEKKEAQRLEAAEQEARRLEKERRKKERAGNTLAIRSIKALLRLYLGSIKALLRLY